MEAFAHVDGLLATGLAELSDDLGVLDRGGWWAVVITYEGEVTCARFTDVRPAPHPDGPWTGPGEWHSSLDEDGYTEGVRRIREAIGDGIVYQANLCRVLEAPVSDPIAGLGARLRVGNPAPHAMTISVPGLEVACASPELYLAKAGELWTSRPIKGTGVTAADLLPKDSAENVMIVDLVRNDLGRVAATGSVRVPELCVVEEHPGLVHLVSTVTARSAAPWAEVIAATFPPGSVTGAPKSSALKIIESLEPVPRGPYCGAIGWVDADRGTAALAVGIRTFWISGGRLRFGTGAGITWGSDPAREWQETELKAKNLLEVAGAGLGQR